MPMSRSQIATFQPASAEPGPPQRLSLENVHARRHVGVVSSVCTL